MKSGKNFKKFLAFVLAAALIVTYMPSTMSAFAEEEAEAAANEAKAVAAEEVKSEPAPAAEEKAEPAPAPAEEVKAEPAPAPAAEEKAEPAPAPAAEEKAEPAPAPAEEEAAEPTPAASEETASQAEEPDKAAAEAAAEEEAAPEAEPEEEEEEVEYPAQSFSGSAGGVSVSVSAPEGALPEGTKMTVSAVSAEEVQNAVEAAIGAEAATIKAVDITFSVKGKKIEPKKAVKVNMNASGMDSEAPKKVVHIADSGAADVVTGNVSNSGAASFSAKDFSIYLVVEEDQDPQDENAVATYEFYVEDELVMTQYIKTGDKLTDPGTSVVNADDANTVFKGWFVGDTAVDFDSEQTVDETETIRVDAKIQHTYYVTFWGEKDSDDNRGIVAVKSVTVEGSESGTVAIDDVTITPKKDTSAFKGWSDSDEGTDAIEDSSVEVTGRMDLYAVVVDAFWLHFYENVGEDSDSDATYTGPVFIAEDEVRSSKKPADPERKGYEFGGWYLDEDCTQEFDWTQTGLEEDTDLYAKWIPGEAAFTVIVWKQKVTDAKDAADDDKTYDFELSAPWTGTTGETVDLSQFSMYEELDFKGFHYNRMEASPEKVKADGTTVVNVYYDRNLLTINFVDGTHTEYEPTTGNQGTQYGLVDGEYIALTRTGNNWTYQVSHEYTGTTYRTVNNNNGTQYGFVGGQMVQLTRAGAGNIFNPYYWTYNGQRYNGTRYATPAQGTSGYGVVDGVVTGISNQDGEWVYTTTETYTGTRYRAVQEPTVTSFTGLYGQSLAQNDYTWPGDRAWYQNPNAGGTRLTFLDAFKFEGLSGTSENDTVLTQYGANQSGNNTVRFYKQNINGTYPTTPTDSIRANATGNFTITEKYEGFKAVQYAHGGAWTNGGAGTSTSVNNLQIRFERQKFTLTLMSEGEAFSTVTDIPYEDALSGHQPSTEPTKAHYNFVGWFEDPTGQIEFDWSQKMPAANKVIYAKFEPKQYHVSLDPNGGEFINTQVGEFNVPLDTILDKTSLITNVVKEGNELVGWFDKDTGSAYGYGKIEEDVNLVAKWRYPGQVQVVYDASPNGSGEPVDNFKYATDSSVVLGAPPETVDEGYAFVAWSVGGKKYYTNNTFDITEEIIEDYDEDTKTGTVNITAIYQELGTGALTPTTITYNANGGEGDDVVVNTGTGPDGELLVNEPIVSLTVDEAGFTRKGYEFDGWNTDPDGAGLAVRAGADIAGDLRNLDNNTDINTLYAQWKELPKYTVVFAYTEIGVTGHGTLKNDEGSTAQYFEYGDIPAGDPTPSITAVPYDGYDFAGWKKESTGNIVDAPDETVTQDETYYATWTPRDDTEYTVNWYYQTPGSEEYVLKETEKRTGTTGTEARLTDADLQPKDQGDGYTYDQNGEKTLVRVTIKGDGTSEMHVYFWPRYSITFKAGDHGKIEDASGTQQDTVGPMTRHYGEDTPYVYNYPKHPDQGYAFDKWDPAIATTVTGDATYTAQWKSTTKKVSVEFSDSSVEKVYTGEEQANDASVDDLIKITIEGEEVSMSDLPEEVAVEATAEGDAKGTDAGTYTQTVTVNLTVEDPYVVDGEATVKGNVELVIKPRPIKIITGSGEKEYDGTALTNTDDLSISTSAEDSYGISPFTDVAEITVTGSQTEVGSSDNTYEITWAEDANKDNFDITDQLGTLTVTGEEPVETAEITYDLNGGEYDGSTDDIVETYAIGEEITIHEAPTREGYEFQYWKGSEYQPGDSYVVEGDHTFTAIWEAEEVEDEEEPEADTEEDDSDDEDSSKGVKTGDENSLMGLLGILGASVIGFFALLFRRRREQE